MGSCPGKAVTWEVAQVGDPGDRPGLLPLERMQRRAADLARLHGPNDLVRRVEHLRGGEERAEVQLHLHDERRAAVVEDEVRVDVAEGPRGVRVEVLEAVGDVNLEVLRKARVRVDLVARLSWRRLWRTLDWEKVRI